MKYKGMKTNCWSLPKETVNSMPDDSDVARSLRSKKSVTDTEVSKFDFDIEEFEIPPSKHLKLVSKGKATRKHLQGQSDALEKKDVADKDALYNLEEKSQKISSMILDIKHNQMSILDQDACDDMLPDSMYSAFHKFMLKQESRMLEMDVVESEAEAERLHLLREKLEMIHWPITLRKVTVVKDPNDEAEISRKRELTKQCIDSMLEKFEAMKNRSCMLARNYKRDRIDPSKDLAAVYNQVDKRRVINYHSSSDEEEEDMSAEQIRVHRRRKRQEQCRGSIIVLLTLNPQSSNVRYAVIAEPLRKAYVVKVSQLERNSWKKQMNSAPKKFEHHPSLKDQVAVFQRRVPIPFTLAAAENIPSAPTTVLKTTAELQTETLSTNNNATNVLDAMNRKLRTLQNNIHSPPIRKKRKKP